MADHEQRLLVRIKMWLTSKELHTMVPIVDGNKPVGREIEVRSYQPLQEFGRNFYSYDVHMCTVGTKMDPMTKASDCPSVMLSVPDDTSKYHLPVDGATIMLLWKNGRLHFDKVRQCDVDDIDAVAKELLGEGNPQLFVMKALYCGSTRSKVEKLGAWRRRGDFVIVDAHAGDSSDVDLEKDTPDQRTFREMVDESLNSLIINYSDRNSSHSDFTIHATKQWTVRQLKNAICDIFGYDPEQHHLKKSVKSYMIKDEKATLSSLFFSNQTPVFLCSGAVVEPGHVYFELCVIGNSKKAVGQIVVPERVKVKELRKKVLERLSSSGCSTPSRLEIPDANYIRLYAGDASGDNPLTVLRDSSSLTTQMTLSDGKTLFAKILKEPEDLSESILASLSVLGPTANQTTQADRTLA